MLFAIFGKAHTFCHSIKRVKGSVVFLLTIFLISAIKYSNQKAGPPLTLPLELPYLPYTMSMDDKRKQLKVEVTERYLIFSFGTAFQQILPD